MRGIEDLDVAGKRVLVRVDFNVPLEDGVVADDARIRAALPTIEELRRRGARLVLVSHLGRPKGHPDPALSLAPAVDRLRELIGGAVTLAPEVVGEEARRLADSLRDGEVLVLENVRFLPGETENDPELARELAELADLYVNDAFGVAHRAHASTEGVAHLLPSAAGRLLEKEVGTLTELLEAPARPLVAIIGGAKVRDKIGVLDRFMEIADTLLIGGAMCFAFLSASGHEVGDSLCNPEDVEHARRLLAPGPDAPRGEPGAVATNGTSNGVHPVASGAAPRRARLVLPSDLVIADELSAAAQHRVLDGVDVPDGWLGVDIGPATAARYAEVIAAAGTIFWNGPMGAFELEPFADGTRRVAEAVAGAAGRTVVGGGDSGAALRQFGLDGAVDYISTGGGAALELLEGRKLPGVQALAGTGAAQAR